MSTISTETINSGLKFIDDSSSSDLQNLKRKDLGLQFVLLGLAEVHAQRIKNLSPLIYELESKVFSEELIRELEPSKLINLYQLGTAALTESSNYLRSTVKSMDWGNIEAQLLTNEVSNSKSDAPTDYSSIADAILARINSTGTNLNTETVKSEEPPKEE